MSLYGIFSDNSNVGRGERNEIGLELFQYSSEKVFYREGIVGRSGEDIRSSNSS